MFDRALAYMERLASAYPEAFGTLLVLVILPLLGSALSFADGWAAKRWPVAVALLRAVMPDVKRFFAILAAKALESRKLPVPPEVRQLTVERVEKAIEQSAPQRTPVRPPPLPLLVVLLVGCTHAEQVQAANGQRTAGHGTARTLDDLCDYIGLKNDATLTQRQRIERARDLDRRGCLVALAAQTALSAAHELQVRALEDAKDGKCTIGANPGTTPACRLDVLSRRTLEAGKKAINATAAVAGAGR